MSIYINLNDEEQTMLREAAELDRRTPQQEAAWLVVTQLQQRKAFTNLERQAFEKMRRDVDDPTWSQAIPVKGGDD